MSEWAPRTLHDLKIYGNEEPSGKELASRRRASEATHNACAELLRLAKDHAELPSETVVSVIRICLEEKATDRQ